MSQSELAAVQAGQKNLEAGQKSLEELVQGKFREMEAQFQSTGLAKPNTIAKLADEFHCFRKLVFGMLGLLRKQIQEFSRIADVLDMRSRRKALICTGFHSVIDSEQLVRAVIGRSW